MQTDSLFAQTVSRSNPMGRLILNNNQYIPDSNRKFLRFLDRACRFLSEIQGTFLGGNEKLFKMKEKYFTGNKNCAYRGPKVVRFCAIRHSVSVGRFGK
jgi:hypothetical protein